MKIDDQLIEYLQNLTRIQLDQKEKEQAKNDLGKIIEYMNLISKFDISAETLKTPVEVAQLREDEVTASSDRELILKNAPNKDKEYFKAPQIIE